MNSTLPHTQNGNVEIVHFDIACDEINERIGSVFNKGVSAVLLIGADISMGETAFGAMLAAHSEYPEAILAGQISDSRHPQLRINAGYWWSENDLVWQAESYIELVPDLDSPIIKPTDYASTLAMLIPRQAWLAIGGFDPRFGAYLADLDWCLRAGKSGFQCHRVRDALFQTRNPSGVHLVDDNTRLKSNLYLASKQGLPYGPWRLAMKRILADIDQEWIRVGFWADYGKPISLPKRVFWFFRNLVRALSRERFRNSFRQTLQAARAASSNRSARIE